MAGCHAGHPSQSALLPRRFADEFITLAVIWYLRKLSYRDLSAIAGQFGIMVAPSTILRWVIRYAVEFEQRWHRFERPVDGVPMRRILGCAVAGYTCIVRWTAAEDYVGRL